MRRALASLLLVFWIAGACVPLCEAQSSIPACCRIDGKHHCALHSPGDGFHAAPCPSYQHATALTSSSASALEAQSLLAVLGQLCDKLLPQRSPEISRFQTGDVQKRGPPLA